MNNIIDEFKWEEIRSSDNVKKIPGALRILASSDNEDELSNAYWSIDNEAIVQGSLFESSLASCLCLLSILKSCKSNSRKYVLELIAQLVSGSPDQSEIDLGNSNIHKRIRLEVSKHAHEFIELISSATEEEKVFCIDIICISATEDASVKRVVIEELIKIRNTFKNNSANKLVENWLLELRP